MFDWSNYHAIAEEIWRNTYDYTSYQSLYGIRLRLIAHSQIWKWFDSGLVNKEQNMYFFQGVI